MQNSSFPNIYCFEFFYIVRSETVLCTSSNFVTFLSRQMPYNKHFKHFKSLATYSVIATETIDEESDFM